MKTANLTWFHIKRLSRHRTALLALIAAPAAVGALRVVFPGWEVSSAAAWACPWVCAAATGAVLYVQHRFDDERGLLDALRGAPVPGWAPALSRAAAGAILFGVQMIAFVGFLALGPA